MKTLIAIILSVFVMLVISGCAGGYGYYHGHDRYGVIIAEPPPGIYVYPHYYGYGYRYERPEWHHAPPPMEHHEPRPSGRTDRKE